MKSIKQIHPAGREPSLPAVRVARNWAHLASYPTGIVVLEVDADGLFVGVGRCASLPLFRFISRSKYA